MVVKIPVSPLSRKILLAEYPAHEASGYIIANSHSLLYRQIVADMPYRDGRTSVLTASIDVDIHLRVARSQTSLMMVGMMIHQEHRDACSRWIQATVAAGQTASHGIRTFADHYDLDDDELPMDTTLRTWQRYVRRHVDLIRRPKEKILQPKIIHKKKEVVFDDDLFAHFIADIVEYIYDTSMKWNHRIVRNLRTMIISRDHQLTDHDTGTPLQSRYTQCRSAHRWMHQHPYVRDVYHKYYGADTAHLQYDKGHRVDQITV